MIDDVGFRYLAVRADAGSDRPSSIIAHLITDNGPLQAVIWNVDRKAWLFDPRTAAAFLYDDEFFDERFHIVREQAEEIAQRILHTELPSEERLRQICASGLAAWMAEEDLSDAFEDDDEPLDGVWKPEDDEPPARP